MYPDEMQGLLGAWSKLQRPNQIGGIVQPSTTNIQKKQFVPSDNIFDHQPNQTQIVPEKSIWNNPKDKYRTMTPEEFGNASVKDFKDLFEAGMLGASIYSLPSLATSMGRGLLGLASRTGSRLGRNAILETPLTSVSSFIKDKAKNFFTEGEKAAWTRDVTRIKQGIENVKQTVLNPIGINTRHQLNTLSENFGDIPNINKLSMKELQKLRKNIITKKFEEGRNDLSFLNTASPEELDNYYKLKKLTDEGREWVNTRASQPFAVKKQNELYANPITEEDKIINPFYLTKPNETTNAAFSPTADKYIYNPSLLSKSPEIARSTAVHEGEHGFQFQYVKPEEMLKKSISYNDKPQYPTTTTLDYDGGFNKMHKDFIKNPVKKVRELRNKKDIQKMESQWTDPDFYKNFEASDPKRFGANKWEWEKRFLGENGYEIRATAQQMKHLSGMPPEQELFTEKNYNNLMELIDSGKLGSSFIAKFKHYPKQKLIDMLNSKYYYGLAPLAPTGLLGLAQEEKK